MKINKNIIFALLLVPFVNGFALNFDLHQNYRGGGYHGEEGRPFDEGEHDAGGYDARDYPEADRAIENRAVDDRAINNASNAANAGAGNAYVPVPQTQPTINVYMPQTK
jgi:hypothetical protein